MIEPAIFAIGLDALSDEVEDKCISVEVSNAQLTFDDLRDPRLPHAFRTSKQQDGAHDRTVSVRGRQAFDAPTALSEPRTQNVGHASGYDGTERHLGRALNPAMRDLPMHPCRRSLGASRCSGAAAARLEVMVSIGTVVMGVGDLHRAVEFWTQALNYAPKREIKIGDDFAILVPAAGHGTHLALDVSETPVQPYPRIHLDLYAGDAADQASEVERLVSLGATRVDWDRYPEDPDFVVLADPEGNRFCVIDTSHT